MADDPEDQARRDELFAGLATIEAFRDASLAGALREESRLAILEGESVPQRPPTHDAHCLAWITEQARRETAAATADLHRNMATINRMRFDHAKREGLQPFTIVQDDKSD